MSCHYIKDVNYDALLTYLLMPSTPEDYARCTAKGLILKQANSESYTTRYGEPMEKPCYSFKPKFLPDIYIISVAILKLCEYYEYQTCEMPDYESSEAYIIIRSIRNKATSRLDGYDKAPWGL